MFISTVLSAFLEFVYFDHFSYSIDRLILNYFTLINWKDLVISFPFLFFSVVSHTWLNIDKVYFNLVKNKMFNLKSLLKWNVVFYYSFGQLKLVLRAKRSFKQLIRDTQGCACALILKTSSAQCHTRGKMRNVTSITRWGGRAGVRDNINMSKSVTFYFMAPQHKMKLLNLACPILDTIWTNFIVF